MALRTQLKDAVIEALEAIAIPSARKELRDQGHVATGKLIRTLRADGIADINRIAGVIYAEDYGLDIDRRRRPNELPGVEQLSLELLAGGWIDAVKPGLDAFEKRRFSINAARRMKKEGSPTKGSFKFSKNGRRTGWIKYGIANREDELSQQIEQNIAPIIERNLLNIIRRVA